jgi:hypothetical protein
MAHLIRTRHAVPISRAWRRDRNAIQHISSDNITPAANGTLCAIIGASEDGLGDAGFAYLYTLDKIIQRLVDTRKASRRCTFADNEAKGDDMPLTSHYAHCVGAIGELLNFAGAVVLAADLFLRQKKEAEAKLLDHLGEWGTKHGLSATHKNVPVSDLEFTAKVLDRWTRRLGYIGIGLMATGFLCLVGDHLFYIYHGE